MAYYVRKPELVEAVQWTGDNLEEIKQLAIPYTIEEGFIGLHSCLFLLDQNEHYRWLWSNYYLVKKDTNDSNLYAFEILSPETFLDRYQPDACDLNGAGCT